MIVPRAMRAGRKRLPVGHITLDSLQEQGLFDVPIQVHLVATSQTQTLIMKLYGYFMCNRNDPHSRSFACHYEMESA